jgi:cytochrome b561
MAQPHYDRFSVLLHWLMAILLLAQLGLGLWMMELPKGGGGVRAYWFNIHKSMGMLLGLLIVIRTGWACARKPLTPLPLGWATQTLAAANHHLLYVCMLAAPLSGFLGSLFSGYPILFFGMRVPGLVARWDAAKALMRCAHQLSAYALMLLVCLHLLAFAYHQFVLKDGLIRRMR